MQGFDPWILGLLATIGSTLCTVIVYQDKQIKRLQKQNSTDNQASQKLLSDMAEKYQNKINEINEKAITAVLSAQSAMNSASALLVSLKEAQSAQLDVIFGKWDGLLEKWNALELKLLQRQNGIGGAG